MHSHYCCTTSRSHTRIFSLTEIPTCLSRVLSRLQMSLTPASPLSPPSPRDALVIGFDTWSTGGARETHSNAPNVSVAPLLTCSLACSRFRYRSNICQTPPPLPSHTRVIYILLRLVASGPTCVRSVLQIPQQENWRRPESRPRPACCI